MDQMMFDFGSIVFPTKQTVIEPVPVKAPVAQKAAKKPAVPDVLMSIRTDNMFHLIDDLSSLIGSFNIKHQEGHWGSNIYKVQDNIAQIIDYTDDFIPVYREGHGYFYYANILYIDDNGFPFCSKLSCASACGWSL